MEHPLMKLKQKPKQQMRLPNKAEKGAYDERREKHGRRRN